MFNIWNLTFLRESDYPKHGICFDIDGLDFFYVLKGVTPKIWLDID